jgi:peptidoglycan/xylan/chitin deacetylase (PgdA/CDA1 family)
MMSTTVNDPRETRPSPLRQLARRAMAAALPRRLFMVSGPPGSRSIALTFDDGPDPAHTPAVLDRLSALGVRATFFVVGRRAEANPGLVARMAKEGHAVGHHSWTHGAPGETSTADLLAEARRTSALLQGLLGKPPRLFRPPNGKLTPGKLLGLWSLGQTVVLWNRDPKDFGLDAVEPLRRRLEDQPISGGDVVLMHDNHAHVAPALDVIVERALGLGLGFCTPDEWSRG